MTKETILEEMERCLIPLSLMNNREHQEFIKSALMGNLSKLADKLVKESDSLPCVSECPNCGASEKESIDCIQCKSGGHPIG